jgi:hypothetical protein
MKNNTILVGFCMLAVIVTSCATKDPLARFYQSYSGEQKAWPTDSSGFVSQTDGINFYHGLPPRSYQVIGRFDRPNLPSRKLAISARIHGANAVCLEEHDITGIKQENGVLLWGNGIAVKSPTTTMPEVKTVAHAFLIKLNSP